MASSSNTVRRLFEFRTRRRAATSRRLDFRFPYATEFPRDRAEIPWLWNSAAYRPGTRTRISGDLSVTPIVIFITRRSGFLPVASSLEKNPRCRVQWNAVFKKFQYRKSTFSDSKRRGFSYLSRASRHRETFFFLSHSLSVSVFLVFLRGKRRKKGEAKTLPDSMKASALPSRSRVRVFFFLYPPPLFVAFFSFLAFFLLLSPFSLFYVGRSSARRQYVKRKVVDWRSRVLLAT